MKKKIVDADAVNNTETEKKAQSSHFSVVQFLFLGREKDNGAEMINVLSLSLWPYFLRIVKSC